MQGRAASDAALPCQALREVQAMGEKFTLLITDRNRHVREFLQREFAAEGYDVLAAQDGRDVLKAVEGEMPPDLLVFDPDIPYAEDQEVLEMLTRRFPPLPVVIHCFPTEHPGHLPAGDRFAIVEKSGNTELLKGAVAGMLRRFHPQRFPENERRCPEEGAD